MIRSIMIIIFMVVVSGCASITRGASEAYAIESEPVGAEASLSNGLSCQTPCSIKVKRRSDFTVTFEKEGYENVTATVTSSVDGAGAAGMAGNVILGGIIGAGVDAGTGAMHSHKPNPLVVKMLKIEDLNSVSNASIDSTDTGLNPLGMIAGSAKVNDKKDKIVADPLGMSADSAKETDETAEIIFDPLDANKD